MKPGSRLASTIVIGACMPFVVLVGLVATTAAQDRLLEGPPFDRLVLEEAHGGEVLEVYPLDLPGRRLPAARPTGTIDVRLLSHPAQTFPLEWSKVAYEKSRLYEQMVLDRALALTDDGKFDQAFDYFDLLLKDYPQWPGLQRQLNRYLQRSAHALITSGQFDRALAALTTLHQRDPENPFLVHAVDAVAGKIIQQRLKDQNYAGARAVLDFWSAEFANVAEESRSTWRGRFREAAAQRVREANSYLDRQDYLAAHRAAQKALTIWPETTGAPQLLARIQREHPQIIVGVFEQAPRAPQRQIDSWPALRVSTLVGRSLFELVDFDAESGVYTSPYGEALHDNTGRRLTLELDRRWPSDQRDAALVQAHALARHLIALADPTAPVYHAPFASLCEAVEVDRENSIHLELRHPHVRPEALLQVPLPYELWSENAFASLRGVRPPFELADATQSDVRFEETDYGDNDVTGLDAVLEQTLPNDNAAVAALLRGEVSILDRLPPWHVARIQSAADVDVGEYRLPTVHVLIPQRSNQLLARREMRRALCYGIDRRQIVEVILSGGAESPGMQVISGPFPTGKSLSDPLRYAYNNQIEPRPYERGLAATLSMVAVAAGDRAEREQNETEGVDPQQLEVPTLTLAHSTDAVARTACQSIAHQLGLIGIPIELKELTTDELQSRGDEFDLRYSELAIWEPLVDAQMLFGPDGLVDASPAARAAVRQLDTATTWKDVQSALHNVHRAVHNDLSVIPLWQTVNYFAYRTDVTGLGDSPITLYQHVERWQLKSGE